MIGYSFPDHAQAFTSWREACANGVHQQFCRKAFLSHQTLSQIEELRQQFFNLLVEADFTNAKAATFTPPGKARVRFLRVPTPLDALSGDPKAVMACVASAMFPKMLVAGEAGGWKTLINSAPASVHPTSVNWARGQRPDFGPHARFIACVALSRCWPARVTDTHSFFNIMQSKRLCASPSS
jgi:ATP-dependent RNA helicase DHX29